MTVLSLVFGLLSFSQSPVVLTVIQAPPLQVYAGSDVQVNKGESVALGGNPTATQGYGNYVYLWTPAEDLNNPTHANPSASPESTTTYRLTVTDEKNCSSTDEVTVTVNASGIEERASGIEIRCYPNPVQDELLVEINGKPTKATFRLISPLGKELFTRVSELTQPISAERIPLRGLPAGLYYLQVITAEATFHQTILKTR